MDILEAAFHPKAIAIAGASEEPSSYGYQFVRHLLDYSYPGYIYPVNPNRQTVLGLKTYPDLISIPEPIDYVICCLPASKVLDLLAQCPAKGVKVVHLVTGRLSETGRQGAKELEAKILQEARRLNIRLIGPNCMGIYYPRQGIAFGHDFPKEAGTVGALVQSGGLSSLLVRYGELQGLRFSKVINYGNALDLDESDLLHYLAYDDETKIIGAYIEGAKDGRKLLDALADAARAKPVVVIKGGRGIAGAKAAASHTAAMAGSDIVWKTAFGKAGVIQAQDLNELVDFLVAFSFLRPTTGKRVGIFGQGGGVSVTAADACEEAGLTVPPLPPEIKEELRTKAPEIWDWLGNPIDMSILDGASMDFDQIIAEVPRMIARSPSFDFVIFEICEDNPMPKEIFRTIVSGQTEEIIKLSREQFKPLVALVTGGKVTSDQFQDWRWKLLAEARACLVAAHIPTYSTAAEAAKALRQFTDYWQMRAET